MSQACIPATEPSEEPPGRAATYDSSPVGFETLRMKSRGSAASGPGTQQLPIKCWHVSNEEPCHQQLSPSVAAADQLVALGPLLRQPRKTFAPESEAVGTFSSKEVFPL